MSTQKFFVQVKASIFHNDSEIEFKGKRIAWRDRRDSTVKVADGVRVVSGKFAVSGGSSARPRLGENDVILEIPDVPEKMAAYLVEEWECTMSTEPMESPVAADEPTW